MSKWNQDYAGAAIVSISSLFYTSGFVYANQHKLHPIINALARGLVLSLISYCYSRHKNVDLCFALDHNFKWQFIRNFIIIIQGFCFSWSQFYLPLPIAFTLNASTPLFVAIFDNIVYGVKLNRRQLFWLCFAFLGVLLIINGNELMIYLTDNFSNKNSSFANYLSKQPWIIITISFLLILTTCLLGLGIVITKKLQNTNAYQTNYYQGVLISFMSALIVPYAFSNSSYHQPNITQFGLLMLFTGIPTAIAGLLYITALTITQNYATITPFQFTGVLLGYALSILKYGQQLNWICLSGTILIAVGVVSLIRSKDQPSFKQ